MTVSPPVAEPAHGTRASYQRGCKCLSCRSANAAYASEYRRLKRAGQSPLGIRIPAARTHILMKVIRGEGIRHGELDRAIFGGHGHYSRIRRAPLVTLRTALKVVKFTRERIA